MRPRTRGPILEARLGTRHRPFSQTPHYRSRRSQSPVTSRTSARTAMLTTGLLPRTRGSRTQVLLCISEVPQMAKLLVSSNVSSSWLVQSNVARNYGNQALIVHSGRAAMTVRLRKFLQRRFNTNCIWLAADRSDVNCLAPDSIPRRSYNEVIGSRAQAKRNTRAC
jgi:hypothetical protein